MGRGDVKMVEAFFQVVQVIKRRAEVVYTRAASRYYLR